MSPEDKNTGDSLTRLENLRQLVFSVNDMDSHLDVLSGLVKEASHVRTSKYAKAVLLDSQLATPETRKLWENIYFLGRLRTAFKRMRKVILTFPSFQKVKFVPLLPANNTSRTKHNPLGLERTLELIDLNMNAATVKYILGSTWTIKGAKRKFIEMQGQDLHIHAEVNMLLHLCSIRDRYSNAYSYIGCSKRSCFMCWNLLRTHGIFSTRGCHGRLYSRWTVPESTMLPTDQSEAFGMALVQVQEHLVEKLKSDFQYSGRLEKTSVVGDSSVFSGESSKENKLAGLSQRENDITQNRVAFAFER